MKRVLLGGVVAVLLCACEKEKSRSVAVLQNVICHADVRSGQKVSKLEIMGDSAAIHKLARWTFAINVRPPEGAISSYMNIGYYGPQSIIPDTINHAYDFKGETVFLLTKTTYDFGGSWMQDTIVPGFLMTERDMVFVAWGNEDGYLDPFQPMPEILTSPIVYDTLGYMKNSEVEAHAARLMELFKEERYEEMLEILAGGYHIYTCTGEEYRRLVELGLN